MDVFRLQLITCYMRAARNCLEGSRQHVCTMHASKQIALWLLTLIVQDVIKSAVMGFMRTHVLHMSESVIFAYS